MTELLMVAHRRAAHGKHVCRLCHRRIAAGELYEDMRCADQGTAYTVRSHLACVSAFCSWQPDYDTVGDLAELSDGHLPPCPMAWDDPAATCLCALAAAAGEATT